MVVNSNITSACSEVVCVLVFYKPIGSCRVGKSITSTFWNTLLFHTMRQTTKISIEGTSILIYFHNPFHPTHRNCSQVKFNAPQRTFGKFFWLYWLSIIIAESDQNNSQVIMIYLSSKNICLLSITRWLHTYILAPPTPLTGLTITKPTCWLWIHHYIMKDTIVRSRTPAYWLHLKVGCTREQLPSQTHWVLLKG